MNSENSIHAEQIRANAQVEALHASSKCIAFAIDQNTDAVKEQTEAIKDQTTAIKALLLHRILDNGCTMEDATADLQLILNRAREIK